MADKNYHILEKPFIDYFERCWNVDMSIGEIKAQLPYLEKYYKDMVIKKTNLNDYWPCHQPNLKKCFKKWSLHD